MYFPCEIQFITSFNRRCVIHLIGLLLVPAPYQYKLLLNMVQLCFFFHPAIWEDSIFGLNSKQKIDDFGKRSSTVPFMKFTQVFSSLKQPNTIILNFLKACIQSGFELGDVYELSVRFNCCLAIIILHTRKSDNATAAGNCYKVFNCRQGRLLSVLSFFTSPIYRLITQICRDIFKYLLRN